MSLLSKLTETILIFSAVILAFSVSAAAVENNNTLDAKPFIITGRVTIQFEDDVETSNFRSGFGKANFNLPSLDALLEQFEVHNAESVFPWRKEKPAVNSRMHDWTRFWEIYFPEDIDVQLVINELKQNPHVRNVEAVWALPVLASPNDPNWSSQWYMRPPGLDPHFYDAWDLETGSDSVIFADVDSGVLYDHPDLKGNIWVNPGEDVDNDFVVFDTDDLNGIDDDGNGVTDDLIGYDFFTGFGGLGIWPGEDPGGIDPDPKDFNGHGTHVAGIAAAMTNNGVGVTGSAGGWYGGNRAYRGASIMCLRVGGTANDGNGYVNSTNCGQAIDYAAMMGADVVNCSWGSQGTATMVTGMNNATAAGVSVFHAAGNDGADLPDWLDLAGYDVISVANTQSNDAKYVNSNYGTWVDVCAPGAQIYNTYSNQYTATYTNLWGTSMASPCAGSVALLIKSMMPSLSREQIDSILLATADNIDAQNPAYVGLLGSGRVNAYSALLDLANAKFSADVTEGIAPLSVNFTDESPNSPVAWEWSFGTGDSSSMQNPSYVYNDPGIYSVSLRVDENNPLGLGEEHLRNYIWVRDDSLTIDSLVAVKGSLRTVPIRLRNTSKMKAFQFAFGLPGYPGLTLDTFSVVGARTDYFEQVEYINNNPTFFRWVINVQSDSGSGSDYLDPGSGIILNLVISIPTSIPSGLIPIDTQTVNFKKTTVSSIWGDYFPNYYKAGALLIGCTYGDANCDGAVGNLLDLNFLVNYVFRSGPFPDPVGGDANGNGAINLLDLNYLVNYVFRSGPPPPPPPS